MRDVQNFIFPMGWDCICHIQKKYNIWMIKIWSSMLCLDGGISTVTTLCTKDTSKPQIIVHIFWTITPIFNPIFSLESPYSALYCCQSLMPLWYLILHFPWRFRECGKCQCLVLISISSFHKKHLIGTYFEIPSLKKVKFIHQSIVWKI